MKTKKENLPLPSQLFRLCNAVCGGFGCGKPAIPYHVRPSENSPSLWVAVFVFPQAYARKSMIFARACAQGGVLVKTRKLSDGGFSVIVPVRFTITPAIPSMNSNGLPGYVPVDVPLYRAQFAATPLMPASSPVKRFPERRHGHSSQLTPAGFPI